MLQLSLRTIAALYFGKCFSCYSSAVKRSGMRR